MLQFLNIVFFRGKYNKCPVVFSSATPSVATYSKAESGAFVVYANTSRIYDALEAFGDLYDIPYAAFREKDQEIYRKLADDSGNAADMVMIQDGAQLTKAIESGLVVNFVPAAVREALDEGDQTPALVHQYINKLFIYSALGDDAPAVRNVWELTDPAMKGRVLFKNPRNEQVNMNFLIMCTKPEWADRLAAAYQSWKGEEISLGEYENAGYKWVAEFLSNVSFGTSDTAIAESVSREEAAGDIGLFVLNKLRGQAVNTENLTVAQYDAAENGYAVEPFSGFMYPMYAMVGGSAHRPYTAMLFIEYLMSREGFRPWGKNLGAYSPNSSVPSNKSDLTIDVWKETLIIEDPEYIVANGDIQAFILQRCP